MKKICLLMMVFLLGACTNEKPAEIEAIDVKEEVSRKEEEKIITHIDAGREDEFVAALTPLIAINSVTGDAAPGMPFGPGPAAALEEALKLAAEWGLITENHEGYVGTADLNGGEDALHILGHLDVVAPGEGWTVTQPYEPISSGA